MREKQGAVASVCLSLIAIALLVSPEGARAALVAAKRDPKAAAALFTQGETYRLQHRDEEAEAAFRKGLALKPDDPVGLGRLGELLYENQQEERAIPLLEKALIAAPRSAKLHCFLGAALKNGGRSGEAKAEFVEAEKLLGSAPSDLASLKVAEMIDSKTQGEEEALAMAEKALALAPEDAAEHSRAGGHAYNLKKYSEAVKDVSEAIRLDPDYLMYHYQLGVVFDGAGQADDSKAEYRKALALAPKFVAQAPHAAWRATIVAALYAEVGDKVSELAWRKKAAAIDPKDYYTRTNLGYAEDGQGDYADAAVQYEAATELRPGRADAGVWENLIRCLGSAGRLDREIELGEKGLKNGAGRSAVFRNLLGVAYSRAKRWADAAAQEKEAVRLSPQDPQLRLNLGYDLLGAGDAAGAAEQYDALKGLDAGMAEKLDAAIHPPRREAPPPAPAPEGPSTNTIVEFRNETAFTAFVRVDGAQACAVAAGGSCAYYLSRRPWSRICSDSNDCSEPARKHPVHVQLQDTSLTYDDPSGGIAMSACGLNWLGTKTFVITNSGVHFACEGPGVSRQQ